MKEIVRRRTLELVGGNPVEFKRYSSDRQQVNPSKRMISIDTLLSRLEIPPDGTVLDIGTGYGYGAILLADRGNRVIALERNKEKILEGVDYWRKLGYDCDFQTSLDGALDNSSQIVFIHGDSSSLNGVPGGMVDGAFSFYISGYMLIDKGTFNDISRVLKPESRFILSTEGPTKLPYFLRRTAVKVLANLCVPKGLHYDRTISLNEKKVYDRHVVILTKK